MVIKMDYVYCDYGCKLSKGNCSNLLQALALCKGQIISNHPLNNGFPEKSVGQWEMFFRLQFRTQEDLNKFQSLGFETDEPEEMGA